MRGLLIDYKTGTVFYNHWFVLRRYPHTKWVCKASKEFRRLWKETKEQDKKIKRELDKFNILSGILDEISRNKKKYESKRPNPRTTGVVP